MVRKDIKRDWDVDKESGEMTLTSKEEWSVSFSQGEQFAKVYFTDLYAKLISCGATSTKVFLMVLCDKMIQYGTNEVSFSKSRKEHLCKTLGIGIQALYNAISTLRDAGVLMKAGAGIYVVNRIYVEYGKAKKESRSKA